MSALVKDPDALTPVEQHGKVWLKRDDLFVWGGSNGSKTRATLALARGASGLVGCAARQSSQNTRVARVAAELGLPCRVHCGIGEETEELRACRAAGAEVRQHKPARASVFKARARKDAEESGWTLIPFGAEAPETVDETRKQCQNVPLEKIRRVVVTVGSGMTLCGLLWGLPELPILGVCVGGDPTKRIDTYAPPGWRERVALGFSPLEFEQRVQASVGGVELDGMYEAKAAEQLRAGDLLWICGKGEG